MAQEDSIETVIFTERSMSLLTGGFEEEENGSEKAASLDQELETGVCYFNNEAFAIDSYVCSGNELLRCEGRGIWVREGARYTDESE